MRRGHPQRKPPSYSHRSAFGGGRSSRGLFNCPLFHLVPVAAHHRLPPRRTDVRTPATRTPCIPISQVLGRALPIQKMEITAFSGDYQRPDAPERRSQSRRIPEWLVANRSSHRQVIHILLHRGRRSQKDGVRPYGQRVYKGLYRTRPFPLQVSTSRQTGPSMTRSRKCQSSN